MYSFNFSKSRLFSPEKFKMKRQQKIQKTKEIFTKKILSSFLFKNN